ncbi:isoleucine--tRNA ligase [Candidatus Bathyarchaeota archaeon]|nr:MAG: isoleucine--tRNA ligase [Candidatus Bathyarchaeota archaeon]
MFKIKNKENMYFLAWTTTPWTLLSNAALAVHPEFEYAIVEINDKKLIFAKELVPVVLKGEKYTIKTVMRGKELAGWEYEPLFTYEKVNKKAYYVVIADFVTLDEGTGVVHIAPAYGEEDYEIGKKYDLPLIQLVAENGFVVDKVSDLKGMFFKDADKYIIQMLKDKGLLLKHGTYEHTYPLCWRCDTPLLNFARDTWFIKMSQFRDDLLKNNQKINWVPSHIRDGRFGNFLENVVDWALSRERYWGTPLPAWVCNSCGHVHFVGSIKELKEMAVRGLQKEDLHRPYIDEVVLKCPKCGSEMRRVPDLIDVWYDSGAAPFAQHHYPFENKDLFKSEFPVDFISEAVDQTRGWFYSLHAISTVLFGTNAYNNVVVLGLILDEKGQKMSKSKNNVVDPWEFFNNYGADSLRWYLITSSAPWEPMRFFPKMVEEVMKSFINTLWNAYAFFVTYANIDKFNPIEFSMPYQKRPFIDRWILSALQSLIKEVREYMDSYQLHKAGRAIEYFINELLSNWYIRRSRRRFWIEETTDEKISAYLTLYEVLVTVIKLLAPFTPFVTEAIYQNLVRSIDKNAPLSVHLTYYPVAKEELIDKSLEQAMEYVLRITEAGRVARFNSKIKARQPLNELIVACQEDVKNTVEPYLDIIKEELNVKRITFVNDFQGKLQFVAKINQKTLGPKYRKLFPKIKKQLEQMDPYELYNILQKGDWPLKVDDTDVLISRSDVLFEKVPPEGFAYGESKGNIQVLLDTKITPELFYEGLAREVVRRIQQMRKDMNLMYDENIDVYYDGSNEILKAIDMHRDYIKSETLTINLKRGITDKSKTKEWKIGKEKLLIQINRLK